MAEINQLAVMPEDIKSSKAFWHTISNMVRYSAVLETLIFLTAVVFLDMIFGSGNRLIGMQLHPFWIIILLITLQYGPGEGLIAAILSSAFLLVGNLPEQSLSETMYEYIFRVMFLPLLWIVTALLMGSIRSRQLQKYNDLKERLQKAEDAANVIVKAYNQVKHYKEQLELRLSSERRSVLTVYEVAKSLETVNPASALDAITKLVSVTINPTKFSLFRLNGNVLRLEASYGWENSDTYARKFNHDTAIAATILGKRKMLSIINAEDENILLGQGMLVSPIIDDRTGKIFGMLKIEKIAFTDLGIRTHETLRIISEWIARVYTNVEKYQHTNPSDAKLLKLLQTREKNVRYA